MFFIDLTAQSLDIPSSRWGISFGNSKNFTGLRFNYRDRDVEEITGINMISIRSEELKGGVKDHGVKRPINGFFEPGQTALIIDDVVSSFAFTKFRAIPILRNAGLNLKPTVCVVIDREEGGAEKLWKQGFELISLLGLHTDVTRYCIEAGLASEKIREMSVEFAEAAKKYSLLQQ